MKEKLTKFKQIDREYILTSKEIKKALGIKGEILTLGLLEGRSPNEIEKGIGSDVEKWYINTREVFEE